ncbi:putative ATP-dependent RNA helicase prh1 [Golovinomyces cichoracearum]|uniref:RNA helicase n=1 Tax=Golovinomyces cichoracearum TaxID=62708 RepID=A0A420ID35_9PEZI|nr:putative ATP-dependent RNA helicase prh1 [Golovinomyces cichoracearum]
MGRKTQASESTNNKISQLKLIAERLSLPEKDFVLDSVNRKKSTGTKRLRDGSPKVSLNVTLESKVKELGANSAISVNPLRHGGLDDYLDPKTSHNVRSSDSTPGFNVQYSTKIPCKQDLISGSSKSSNGNGFAGDRFLANRKKLPIWSKQSEIRSSLVHRDVLLLKGDTGSGKSTQVPQFLCHESWCRQRKVNIKLQNEKEENHSIGGIIAVTQPRRIAAITLAKRVAHEMGSSIQMKGYKNAGLVGYSVRFDKFSPVGMKIKFVTEGTLLQEMLLDPYLKQYSAIIVDEIHERSVDVDLILGFLKNIVYGDKSGRGGIPLKVVIMSATLDLDSIQRFFTDSTPQRITQLGSDYNKAISPHNSDVKSGEIEPRESHQKSNPHLNDLIYSDIGDLSNSEKCKIPEISNTSKSENPQSSSSKVLANAVTKESMQKTLNPTENFDQNSSISMTFVEGRQYNVEIIYETKPTSDYISRMLQIIMQTHVKEPLPGDILAFLTGQEEIETLQAELQSYSEQLSKTLPRMKVLPLYGSLSAQAQQEAFEKVKEKFTRKVVLATNIAETSITVSGVRYVVDCGKSKVKQYRPRLGLESLLEKPISKVSAIQRAGRAGREAEGKCFRLYTEQDYNKLDMNEVPEILRSDVVEAVLKMKARGVGDILGFPLMDSPKILAMEKALVRLHLMDALNNDGDLTEIGKKIARFPLPASYGRVLAAVENSESNYILDLIDIISCLTTDSEIFLQPRSEEDRELVEDFRKDIHHRDGDVITLLQTMQRYTAETTNRNDWCQKRMISLRAMKMALQIRKQLRQICYSMNFLKEVPLPDPQPVTPPSPDRCRVILKIFLKAFATNTALMAPNGGYITTQGKNPITIHPSSVLYGQKLEAIMFLDHIFTAKSYARRVSVIEAPWILEALTM